MKYLLLVAILSIPLSASGMTCLQIENLQGKEASERRDYEMGDSKFGEALKFCYEGEYGSLSNHDGEFQRFGSDTWIWFNNTYDTEHTKVLVFDFTNRKVLYTSTRTADAMLSASVSAMVGDINLAQPD